MGPNSRGETSITITRLLAGNYGSSEYSPKIRIIGSTLSAVTSVVRISMQSAVQCMHAVHCTHSRTVLPQPRTGGVRMCAGHSQRTVQYLQSVYVIIVIF